ncbi:unnamed protein product [Darwinula stevensoni]|uniref:Kringle domain-containing protein n=1 Tax=Darwinula stevensoni TaxID=69355 RepID=A0A7R9AAT2_9CRUS|nr:unnamed protein product [Darwinula stevensoni]CAG0898411.1 unnamed protein product [Darwinula stevensoni]
MQGIRECKVTPKGGEYMGRKNVTISGFPCKPWYDAENKEEDRFATISTSTFPDEHKVEHNYCRNPNGNPGGPWCNIKDSGGLDLPWEYCDVPFCGPDDQEEACEAGSQCEPKYPECRMTEMGKEYMGTRSQTESGKKCLHWKDKPESKALEDFMLSHLSIEDVRRALWERSLEMWNLKLDWNYCRNPGFRKRPWCFVSYENLSWEYCNIPLCKSPNEPMECKLTIRGREYAGFTNVARNGEKCQPWLSQTPNKHSELLQLPMFPDPGIDSRNSYCRNPNNNGDGPWCYTETGTGPHACKIPFCWDFLRKAALKGTIDPTVLNLDCRLTEMGKEYVGIVSVTESGAPCLSWDLQPYGKTDDFDTKISYEKHFHWGNPSKHQNYCRNPTSKNRPWCFVGDPEKKWEYCDVPLCPIA